MNRAQKIAWLNLTTITIFIILSGVVAWVLTSNIQIPQPYRELLIVATIAVLMLPMKFARLIFRKKPGQISHDERDELIRKKATLIAYTIFWFFLVAACMTPFFLAGPNGSVPSALTVWILLGGFLILKVSASVTILILYSLGGKENE
ncbi:MAG: hypothetical protein KAS75_02955 [Planctomycetes bacterium]|nr:hypothetical protein [Planctomycetota bacterium]